MKLQNKRLMHGFTLIELLLVIAILGILTILGIVAFTSSLQKGRDSKRKNDLRQIGIALEAYYADKKTYPIGSLGVIQCSDPATCTWGGPFSDGSTIYMTQLPQDDVATQQYYYVSPDGSYFQLYARLENSKDNDITHNGSGQSQVFLGTNCGNTSTTVHCDYGVSSTNKSPTDAQIIGYE